MALIASLNIPYTQADPDSISAPITNRFPTPPSAWGFMVSVDTGLAFDGVTAALTGAVFPESIYLEPIIGQIWPR